MKIITNNQYRPQLDWYDLTAKEQADFDYAGAEEGSYFRYKGTVRALDEYPVFGSAVVAPLEPDSPFVGWDAAAHDTYFSGTCIKVSPCGEAVVVGTYYS